MPNSEKEPTYDSRPCGSQPRSTGSIVSAVAAARNNNRGELRPMNYGKSGMSDFTGRFILVSARCRRSVSLHEVY